MTSKEWIAYLVDRLQTIGPVSAKRMFGGYGLFLDGLMFALLDENTLYLKVDDATRPAFEEHGLEAFTYEKQGKTCSLAYYQAPEECLEDLETMNQWANQAYAVACRAAAKKHRVTGHAPSS